MSVTSYANYVRELKEIIDQVHDRPFDYNAATIEAAIYKNGYGYRCRESLSEGRLSSEYQIGSLRQANWKSDSAEMGRSEIDQFFQLPEIYAFSDHALAEGRDPLSTAHWDATVGLVDIFIRRNGCVPKRQRMLFAGFSDNIHAEFFLSVDRDIVVHDHNVGGRLFEWRLLDEPICSRNSTCRCSSLCPMNDIR